MSTSQMQCPNCFENVTLDPAGDCPVCGENLIQYRAAQDNKLQFYCAVCEDFFFGHPDDTGFNQAPCPECGDLSNTPDFHVSEMRQDKETHQKAWFYILKFLAAVVGSSVVWAILSSMF